MTDGRFLLKVLIVCQNCGQGDDGMWTLLEPGELVLLSHPGGRRCPGKKPSAPEGGA